MIAPECIVARSPDVANGKGRARERHDRPPGDPSGHRCRVLRGRRPRRGHPRLTNGASQNEPLPATTRTISGFESTAAGHPGAPHYRPRPLQARPALSHPPVQLASRRPGGHLHLDRSDDRHAGLLRCIARIEIHGPLEHAYDFEGRYRRVERLNLSTARFTASSLGGTLEDHRTAIVGRGDLDHQIVQAFLVLDQELVFGHLGAAA